MNPAATAVLRPEDDLDLTYPVGRSVRNITRLPNGKFKVRIRVEAVSHQTFVQATFRDLATALAKQAAWEAEVATGEMPADLITPDAAPRTGRNARVVPMVNALAPVRAPSTSEKKVLAINSGMGTRRALPGVLTIRQAAEEYERAIQLAPANQVDISYVIRITGETPLRDAATPQWAMRFVRMLQDNKEFNLAPGTIRKRVEALARIVRHHRFTHGEKSVVKENPFENMPANYSQYPTTHATPKSDIKRERRLTEAESDLIDRIFAGHKPDHRERSLFAADGTITEIEILYRVLVNGGLRLIEAYRIESGWVNKNFPVVTIKQSKDRKNVKPVRHVGLPPQVHALLLQLCEGRADEELIFGFLEGNGGDTVKTTRDISRRLAAVFEHAGAEDMTVHDLRHEAACRVVTMRNADGSPTLADAEIIKMFGWTKPDMLQRYLSLRSDDVGRKFAKAFAKPILKKVA